MSQLVIERCDADSTIAGGNPQDPMNGGVGQGGSLWVVVGRKSSVHAGRRMNMSLTGVVEESNFLGSEQQNTSK